MQLNNIVPFTRDLTKKWLDESIAAMVEIEDLIIWDDWFQD
jgi:hypothetical protein